MSKTTKGPTIGDTAWFVEWCVALAFYEDSTDVDHDRCTMATRRVGTREEAERIAREVYPVAATTLGWVAFWPAEYVPYDPADAALYPRVGYWDATADCECYSGDD